MGYSSVTYKEFTTGDVNDGYKVSFYISNITNNSAYMITKIESAVSIAL